jgi:UDP-galactopyranose mutase
MPIDRLVKCTRGCPSQVRAAAQTLVHTSVVVVGVGYEQPLDDSRSWLYFPDSSTPFYRATNFAKYAASNVPNGETSRFCSYMTETSYRSATRPALPDLEERVIESLRDAGLAAAEAPLASVHSTNLEYAYPVPTLDRDKALATIEDWLVKRGIHSRGRFGEWRYESGNMDHAVKSGIDTAHRLVEEPAKAIGS